MCDGPVLFRTRSLFRYLSALAVSMAVASVSSTAQELKPELVEQTGHSASVDALVFSPDGRWLISGGHDDGVKLWAVESGRQIRTLGIHMREVEALAICPSGQCVASGSSDGLVTLWELPGGRQLRTFAGHSTGIEALAFSSDGRQLVSAGGDPPNYEHRKPDFSVKVWDVQSGKELRRFEGNQKIVSSLSLSPDGNWLLSGCFDGTLRIWEYHTGRLARSIPAAEGEVRGYFNADATKILTVSANSIDEWDPTTGKLVRTITGGARPYRLALRPGGKEFAYTSEHRIKIVDISSGATLHSLGPASDIAESVAYSPDGMWIAYGDARGTITIARSDQLSAERTIGGYAESLRSMAISPNGTWIASGEEGHAVRIWNIQTGALERSLSTECNQVEALAFDPTGSFIAIGGFRPYSPQQTSVELWDVVNGKRIREISQNSSRTDFLKFSFDGHWLAIGAKEGFVTLWDLHRNVAALRLSPANKAVAFSPTGEWVATGGMDNALSFWQLPSGRPIGKYSNVDWGYAASPDGRLLATVGRNKTFKVWETRSLERASNQPQPPPGTIFSLGLNPRRHVHSFEGHRDFVSDLVFSPDSRLIASASWDGDVRLWDANEGRGLFILHGHTSRVVAVAFSPDGKHLLSASADGTIRIWNATDGQELLALIPSNYGDSWVAVAPDGLFDGTWKGMQEVAWRDPTNGAIVPLDSFFTDFFYPGLLPAIMNNYRPHAQFDIATAVQVPALRSMLEQKLAHVEFQSGKVVVCFQQIPGAALGVTLFDDREAIRGAHGYEVVNSSSCRYRKVLELADTASAMKRLQTLKTSQNVGNSLGVLTDTSSSTFHVLVIGVSQYASSSGFTELPYAVRSAEAIQRAFFTMSSTSASRYYARIKVWDGLFDGEATRSNIESRLSELASEVKPDDVVFLYFAGHGEVPSGQEMFYFIPSDGKGDDPNSIDHDNLKSTGISTAMLAESLRTIRAGRIVLILDACQSGAAVEALGKIATVKAQVEAGQEINEGANSSFARRKIGVYLVAAALPLSFATGLPDGRSILADALLDDFQKSRGNLTASRMTTDIRESLPEKSEKVINFRQTPLTESFGIDFRIPAQ